MPTNEKQVSDIRFESTDALVRIAALQAEQDALRAQVERLTTALTELVDAIEISGGHDEDGNVFDLTAACEALATCASQ